MPIASILKLCVDWWRELLIVSLSVALSLSILHGRALRAERDAKTVVIDSMLREAKSFKDQSKQTAKETSDAFTLLVEQNKEKDIALTNAKKRFGSCNVARGVGPVGVLPTQYGAGQAGVPENTGEPSVEERLAVTSEFVDGCAEDSAFVRSVHEWRVGNTLPISAE